MRKRILALAAVAALTLSACGEANVTAPPLSDSIKVVYDTVPVERGDVTAMLVYSGYVLPAQVEVSFEEVSGVVERVYVKAGDAVKAGDPLLELDTKSLRERLESAEEQLENLASSGQRDRRLLEIDLELAKLDCDEAREADPESVETRLAELEVRHREASLKGYDEQLSRTLTSARENVTELRADIEASILRAPVSGEVLTVYTSEGARATSSSTLVSISDGDKCYISCSASDKIPASAEVSFVSEGEEYALERWEYTDRELAAFEAVGESAPHRFVRADGGELPASGEFVQLHITRESSPDTLKIPLNALYRDSGVTYVYVVEDGETVYREVKVGVSNDAFVEITAGLEEGDEVYVGK